MIAPFLPIWLIYNHIKSQANSNAILSSNDERVQDITFSYIFFLKE